MSDERALVEYLGSDPERTVKLVVPARVVGDGGIVTKIRGEKTYMITRRVRVFQEGHKSSRNFEPDEGMVFLVPADGPTHITVDINSISQDTDVVWHVNVQDIEFAMGKIRGCY